MTPLIEGWSLSGRTLLGSTSQQVVRFAPCPVAVLPPQAAATWARPERTYAGEGA